MSWFKRKPKAASPAPEALVEALRTQFEIEQRIERAVARYGRELTKGTPFQEAFATIAVCLEDGAAALESKKN